MLFNSFLFFAQLLTDEFSEKLFLFFLAGVDLVVDENNRNTTRATPVRFSFANLQIKALCMDHQKTLCSYNLLMVISYKKLFVKYPITHCRLFNAETDSLTVYYSSAVYLNVLQATRYFSSDHLPCDDALNHWFKYDLCHEKE